MNEPVTLDHDTLVRFVLEKSGIRGVLAHLDRTWLDLRGDSRYPTAVARCLGEACAASALFTGHIKTQGRLSVQMRGTGALRTLFAECTAAGTLRAIAQTEPEWAEAPAADTAQSVDAHSRAHTDGSSAAVPSNADAAHLDSTPTRAAQGDWSPDQPEARGALGPRDFGDGALLAINIEHPRPGQQEPIRYQSLVGLHSDTLSGAFEDYFAQSEQLPTRMLLSADDGCAAGLMLQRLPETRGDADGWNRACALFATLSAAELRETPALELLYRLFHEDGVRILGSQPLRFACSCSRERVAAMLVSLGEGEALEAAHSGVAEITCEFCNRRYRFDRVDLGVLFRPHPVAPPKRRQ